MVDIQGVKFPGYGQCIYCGSTGPLKDEHIIPFSLGGKAVIEAASCGDCEKVTSYLDGYLARQIFHEYRAHAGMKSRRPKERPSELAATIVKPDGTHEVRTFAPKEHPYFLIMPVWNLPGILLNEEPTNNFEIMQAHAYWWIPESMQKTAEGSFCGHTRMSPIMSASRGKTRRRQNRRATYTVSTSNRSASTTRTIGWFHCGSLRTAVTRTTACRSTRRSWESGLAAGPIPI